MTVVRRTKSVIRVGIGVRVAGEPGPGSGDCVVRWARTAASSEFRSKPPLFLNHPLSSLTTILPSVLCSSSLVLPEPSGERIFLCLSFCPFAEPNHWPARCVQRYLSQPKPQPLKRILSSRADAGTRSCASSKNASKNGRFFALSRKAFRLPDARNVMRLSLARWIKATSPRIANIQQLFI